MICVNCEYEKGIEHEYFMIKIYKHRSIYKQPRSICINETQETRNCTLNIIILALHYIIIKKVNIYDEDKRVS